MAVASNIKSYLEKEGVAFEEAAHPLAYTAAEVAGLQHIPGKQMIKVVIVKYKNEFIMCVLPAIHMVDFEKLKAVLGSDPIELATEKDFEKLFPEYELGAEPPFGHLYGMRVFADRVLEEGKDIVFNAGTHTDVIKMSFKNYKDLAKPIMADIGSHI